MRRAVLSFALLCLLSAAARADEEAVTIAWKPKPGTTTSFRYEIRNLNSSASWVFSAVSKSKVVDVAADGKIRLQVTQSDATLTVGGQDMSGQLGDANESTEVTYLPNGLSVTAPDGPRARIDAALRMLYPDRPVKVGDTWKRAEKADASKGLRAAEATYKYEGIETVGKWKAYKIAVTYHETEGDDPISLSGTKWLSVEEGHLVKAQCTLQNGPFAPGMPPEAEAEITGTRID
jgi:hypothetical protein